MIKSFSHKGLKAYYESQNLSKIEPTHQNRLRTILTVLKHATSLNDIDLQGFDLHILKKPPYKGYYAIKVTGSWRVIFQYSDGNVYKLDYMNYH